MVWHWWAKGSETLGFWYGVLGFCSVDISHILWCIPWSIPRCQARSILGWCIWLFCLVWDDRWWKLHAICLSVCISVLDLGVWQVVGSWCLSRMVHLGCLCIQLGIDLPILPWGCGFGSGWSWLSVRLIRLSQVLLVWWMLPQESWSSVSCHLSLRQLPWDVIKHWLLCGVFLVHVGVWSCSLVILCANVQCNDLISVVISSVIGLCGWWGW